MSVLLIIEPTEVWDAGAYGEYCRRVPALVERHGGKYLARDMAPVLLTGDWSPSKVVIIEFPSQEMFALWWNSPEYRELAALRERSAIVNSVLVHGQ